MKVLYLVPPGQWPRQLTPFSFLDEELQALADAGVEAFVLSTAVEQDQDWRSIRVLAVPRGSFRERTRVMQLLWRQQPRLPRGWPLRFRSCAHALRLEQRAADAVRAHGIDLVHAHFGSLVGFGGLIARAETGVPLVVSLRGMDLLIDRSIDYGLRRDWFYDRTLPLLLSSADATTYGSEFMRREGIKLGAEEASAMTIRKGVDLQHFRVAQDRDALRRELGFSEPMILVVAGLIPRKGVDLILRALGELSPGFRYTLAVCGDGPEAGSLQQLAAELGIAERVRFLGRVPRSEIQHYFAACDVFVLASRWEAAGNVLLEAMASGRPVISTDAGGSAEYVYHGSTGFVVPRDDIPALAARLSQLLSDSELRERLGREGRRVAEREHPYGRLVNEYRAVYLRVAGCQTACVA